MGPTPLVFFLWRKPQVNVFPSASKNASSVEPVPIQVKTAEKAL